MQQSQKENKTFEEGTWGVEIYEGLEPDVEGNGDVVISKHWCSRYVLSIVCVYLNRRRETNKWTNSSFQNTDLDYQLKQRDITHLVFGGLTANTCLESTARYAYEL